MNLVELFSSAGLIKALGWTMLHSLWQGMAIMVITAIVLALLRHSRATVRYIILCVSMIMVALSVMITFVVVSHPGQGPMAADDLMTSTAYMVRADAPSSQDGGMITLFQSYSQKVSGFIEQNSHLMVLAWLLGFLFFMLRYAGGLYYIGQLRRNSAPLRGSHWQDRVSGMARRAGLYKVVRVLESHQVKVPMTVGHLKPVILFPVGMITRIPPEQVEAILMHELAHILRRDYLVNLLQSLMEALFFYHPAIWWLSQRMRVERENICDDITLQQSNDPITYIKALTTMEELTTKTPAMATAITGSKKRLMNRVSRMVRPDSPRVKSSAGLITLFALFMFVFLLGTGANLNALKAGTSLPAAEAAFHPDAMNSLAMDFVAEESHATPVEEPESQDNDLLSAIVPASPDNYVMTPDTTEEAKKKEYEEQMKKTEQARKEAMEMLEKAQQQKQEAMEEYQKAIQNYHETMKELRKEEYEKQFKWVYVDSLDSIAVVGPRGLKDFYIYGGSDLHDVPLEEYIWHHRDTDRPGRHNYSFHYSLPDDLDDIIEEEDVRIIVKELEDDILLDIYKDHDFDVDHDFDIDVETEREWRKAEKQMQKMQKDLDRKIIVSPQWERGVRKFREPHVFIHHEPGPEQIIRQELKEDRLIQFGKEYVVELNNGSMYINGEKQPRSVYKKYKKIYEGVSGEDLDVPVKMIF